MVMKWLVYMTEERRTLWRIPVAEYTALGGLAMTAHLEPMAGAEELDPESEYGYAIYVGIMPPGGATLEEAASEDWTVYDEGSYTGSYAQYTPNIFKNILTKILY
jgi:hypothetical protein